MTDMEPSNESCIYSTLSFVTSMASKYDVNLIITFDQPLWYKTQMSVDTEPSSNYNHVLPPIPREIAISRVIRGQLLAETALYLMITAHAFCIDIPNSEVSDSNDFPTSDIEKTSVFQ